MKTWMSIFNFVFALIFFVQSTAWASGTSTTYSPQMLEKMVERYNAMSDQQKKDMIQKWMKSENASDQKFVESLNLQKMTFPKLKHKAGKLAVVYQNKEYEYVLKGRMVSFRGHELDFGPGKMESAFKQLEKIVTAPSFSVIDLFISPAYALAEGLVFGLFMAAAIIIPIAIFGSQHFLSDAYSIGKMCNQARERLDVTSQEDYQEVAFSIDRNLSDIDSNEDCSDQINKVRCSSCRKDTQGMSEYEYQKNAETCAPCDTYSACSAARKCLNSLKDEIKQRLTSVNASERNIGKDVPETSRKPKESATSATKQ